MVKELTKENLSVEQAKYFKPSKALPWKDWIVDKSFQGMTYSEIHRRLLAEFPESKDVTLDSLKRLAKKYKLTTSKNKKKTKTKLNKSDEIRKLVKEMIANRVELNGSNILKTLANRGIKVSYTHAAMAIGQAIINKEILLNSQTPQTTQVSSQTILKQDVDKCSLDDLIAAKEFIDRLGGLEKTINAISAFSKISK
jgi:hypothetical protein